VTLAQNTMSGNLREIIGTLTAHGFSDGTLVLISGDTGSGSASALYNGVFAVYDTATDPDEFKFQIPVNGPVPSGSHSAAKMSVLRFDVVMNSLPANAKIHLGPTPIGNPFLTKGYADGVSGGWQPKAGMKIVGSGIDVTVLQQNKAAASCRSSEFADLDWAAPSRHKTQFTFPGCAV
jgi:hypothetical protein